MYRWERRDRKLNSKRNRMPKHGKGLATVYLSSITKREREAQRKNKQRMRNSDLY